METPSNSSFLPMRIDASMDAFRVDGTLAVRALVRELMSAQALVTVYAADDPEAFVITSLRSLEADAIELEIAGGEATAEALSQAPYLTAVGLAGSVKIQFQLEDVEVVGAAGPEGVAAAGRLSAAVPTHGWRVQRRNTFRVKPPARDNAIVAVRLPDGREVTCRVADLSVGGLALLCRELEPRPAPGAVLRHCRIEAGGIAAIPCDLRIVQLEDSDSADQALLLRAEFVAMPQTVARFVQMYVMDIERRARLAGSRR